MGFELATPASDRLQILVLDRSATGIGKDSIPRLHAMYEIVSKNMVEPEEPQMTSEYGTYAWHAG